MKITMDQGGGIDMTGAEAIARRWALMNLTPPGFGDEDDPIAQRRLMFRSEQMNPGSPGWEGSPPSGHGMNWFNRRMLTPRVFIRPDKEQTEKYDPRAIELEKEELRRKIEEMRLREQGAERLSGGVLHFSNPYNGGE